MHHITINEMLEAASHSNILLGEIVGASCLVERQSYSITKIVIPKNGATKKHYHQKSEEIIMVTKGSGEIVINDKEITVAENIIIFVEPGDIHYAKSSMNDVLEYIAISLPAFVGHDYIIK